MIKGPPQTPPNPDTAKFTTSQDGDTFCINADDRMDTYIYLNRFHDYLQVININVTIKLQGLGIGKKLYEESLKFAKISGKLGVVSNPSERISEGTNSIWKKFYEEGRAKRIRVGDKDYDLLFK